MLMFDFYCPACQETFEDLVKSDVLQTPCPNCSFGLAERQISAPTIDPAPWIFGKHASEPAVDKWAKNRRRKIEAEKRDSAYHD